MFTATLFWVVAIVLFVIVEGASVALVSIWFAVGALASLVVSFFVESIWVQIWIFLIVSLASLIALKPFAKRFLTPYAGRKSTNFDRIVGMDAVVREEICNLESRGLVKVMGQDWTARSQSGENIPVGTTVTIDRIEGVKVFVTPKQA